MKNKGLIIGIIIAVVLIVVFVVFAFGKGKKKKLPKQISPSDDDTLTEYGFPKNPSVGDIYWTDEDGDGHNETKWEYGKSELFPNESEAWIKQ